MIKSVRLIILLLIVCHCSILSGQDRQYFNEFYTALNSLIRSKFKDISQITNASLPIFRTPYGNAPSENDSIEVPPPPPPGVIYYDQYTFYYMTYSDQLDSSDVKFMYQSIDSTKTFQVDQNRISLKVIPAETVFEILRKSEGNFQGAADLIEKTFGSRNFIRVSTPIFNSDYSRIIITVTSFNGPKSSFGETFVMKKKNNSWKTVKANKTVTRKKL
jgi:hypothetical protein